MRTAQNLHLHELIGLNVKITNSSSRELIGLEGKVVDETKNLLVIETEKKEKKIRLPTHRQSSFQNVRLLKIPKISSTFLFTLENGEKVELKGKEIAFRPEERTKKAM